MSKTYHIDMCHGPILPKILRFAIPLMCSSILQLLFNAADVIMVGRFCGENSMAAVGSTSPIINLMTNFFMGLSISSNVLVAKYMGSGEKRKVHDTVHTAVAVSLVCGAFLTVFGIVFTEKILILMQTPKEVLPLAVQYLRIYFMGISFVMVFNFCNSILRAVGDTKRPLYYLLTAGVINVLLNMFFVIVLDLNVVGVGLATIISQFVSLVLILRCLIRERECFRLIPKRLKVDKKQLSKLLSIGIPAGIYGTVFSLSNVVIQSSVNSFGPTIMAGSAAAGNIEGFVYMSMNSFHQAAISFTSQNYGAGDLKRIKKVAIISLSCVFVTGLVMGQSVCFFGNFLLGIYSTKQNVISAGMVRLYMVCGTYFLCGLMDVMVGLLRGLEKSMLPTVVSLIGACGLRLVWIFTIFKLPEYHTPTMLFFSYPLSWIITLTAHVVCFLVVFRKIKLKLGDGVYPIK